MLDSPPYFVAATPLRYTLAINNFLQQTNVLLEVLENVRTHPGQDKPYQYFRMLAGGGSLSLSGREGEVARDIAAGTLTPGQSIFHEIRDPISHQEMFWVRLELEKFHFYREWKMGKNSAARKPQRTDFPTNSLAEDFSNLALVLNLRYRDRLLSKKLRKIFSNSMTCMNKWGLESKPIPRSSGFVKRA